MTYNSPAPILAMISATPLPTLPAPMIQSRIEVHPEHLPNNSDTTTPLKNRSLVDFFWIISSTPGSIFRKCEPYKRQSGNAENFPSHNVSFVVHVWSRSPLPTSGLWMSVNHRQEEKSDVESELKNDVFLGRDTTRQMRSPRHLCPGEGNLPMPIRLLPAL